MGSVAFTIYFFFVSWWRRLRPRPPASAPLPLYAAAPASLTGGSPAAPPPSEDDSGPASARAADPAPDPAPSAAAAHEPEAAWSLDDRLHREHPSLHRLYRRVVALCEQYGVCTASNTTLGRDWHAPGRHFSKRQVQRLLARLAELRAIEVLELPQEQIRTGRAIRLPSETPAQQLQLRLGDARARRLTPREIDQGCADPPAPLIERRRREARATSTSPATSPGVTHDMSPDPRIGDRFFESEALPADPAGWQAPPAPGGAVPCPSAHAAAAQPARGAATAVAMPSAEEARARREKHLECKRRRRLGLRALFDELHPGAATCAECEELGGIVDKNPQKVADAWLFPSEEALAAAKRGHLPLGEVGPDAQGRPPTGGTAPPAAPAQQRVRLVSLGGAPAYHDGTQWMSLTEEAAAQAVAEGWAVDDRPPPPTGPPSTCVRPEREAPPIVPPPKLGSHLRSISEQVREELGGLVEAVGPVLELVREGPRHGEPFDLEARAACEHFLADLAPVVAAAEALERHAVIDAADVRAAGGWP